MKRFGVLLAIALLVCVASNSYTQTNRTVKNGFSLNLVFGFPSDAFGLEDADDIDSEYGLGMLWGGQIGNRWYFSPTETAGIGLMVNWFDFTMAGKSGSDDFGDWARAVMDISFLEFGPVGTLALSDEIALDGYYNLRPTFLISGMVFSYAGLDDETYAYGGMGISHALGAAFRYKVLNIGLEYVLGGINSKGTYTGDLDQDLEDMKNKTNSFRIMLGVKF